MLELYLRELERELARTLPPEDVALRLAEAEGHLREGVEGRVELGQDEVEAVRETIHAFGTVRRLAASQPRHEGRATARQMIVGVGYGVTVAAILVQSQLLDLYPALMTCVLYGWFVLGIGFAVAAFRARRPHPLAVGGAVLGSAILTWIVLGTTFLNLYAFGGTGLVPPGDLPRFVNENRRLLAEHVQARSTFDVGWATIQGPQGIEGLRGAAGYRAPVVQPVTYNARLVFETVPDAKTAFRAWTDVRRHGSSQFETESFATDLRAVDAARSAPVKNCVSMLPDLFLPNVGIAALAILVDYAFGGLGVLAFRMRRRRRTNLA